jgi:tetratricopeptide (TPR) repeat protein
VLMGRVRQVGDGLNIQVDLIDATTGAQLWGQEYERKVSDMLSVKQTIAREVTEKLRLRLSGEEQRQLVRRDTTNAEAYQFYLRGRYFWNKRTADGIKKAIGEFQQVIERDPNYALGYVGLADCYAVLEQYAGTPASETLPKAKAAALRALQIDESLAEAHTSLGYTNTFSWQFGEAEKELKRGIDLNPNYPTAHQWYGVYLRAMGRVDEAMAEFKRAQQLDPLSPTISSETANLQTLKGDLNSAIEQCKKTIELDPSYSRAYGYLGWAYLKQGREHEAMAALQKAVEVSGRASQELGFLGYGYAALGKRAEAMAIARELEEKYAKKESPAMNLAAVYAGLGEKDQAFAWLERDFQARSGVLIFIAHRPVYEPLRDDPRYTDLLRRIGLKP